MESKTNKRTRKVTAPVALVPEVIEQPVEQIEAPQEQAAAASPSNHKACECGCGLTGPGRFRPGHDARLHGRVKRARENRLEWGDLTPAEVEAVRLHQGDLSLYGSFAIAKSESKSTKDAHRVKVLEKKATRLAGELTEVAEELEKLGVAYQLPEYLLEATTKQQEDLDEELADTDEIPAHELMEMIH